jgi:hypothetical protein
MNPSTPKTELPPSTRLRKVVFGGSLMNAKKFIERSDLNALLACLWELDGFRPDSTVESEKPDFIITKASPLRWERATDIPANSESITLATRHRQRMCESK